MESNDSPEIPDSGETSEFRGLPSGDRAVLRRPLTHFAFTGEADTE